jgi:hypothetical protein
MGQKTVMGPVVIGGRLEFNGFVVARLTGSLDKEVKWAFEDWLAEAARRMKQKGA